MLFDQITKQMIEKMIESPLVEINYFVRTMGMSKSQVEYHFGKVNDQLDENDVPLIYCDGRLVTIELETKEYFLKLLLSDDFFSYYELNSDERRKYIYLMLMYHQNNYLSINHFIEALKISKTTFMNDIKQLEKDIPQTIFIKYSRQRGYFLDGSEVSIRSQLIKMIIQDYSNTPDFFVYDFFIYNEKIKGKKILEQIISQNLKTYNINLVENRFQELLYMLIFLLPRMEEDWFDFYNQYNFQTFFSMKEYSFSKNVLTSLGVDHEHAFLYLTGWVLGMSMGDYTDKTPDFSIIDELVLRIVKRFESLSGIRFKDRQQVINQLYSHFRPAYYRMYFRFPIVNVLSDKIKNEYTDLFYIVEETMKPICNLFDYFIPDEEISFLTIHFASLIDNFDEYKVQRKVGVIVCPNGIGSSAIIYNELKMIFPEIILLGPIETEELEKTSMKFDIIFTTVRNMNLYRLQKPVFLVNPIMSTEERFSLKSEVYNMRLSNPFIGNPIDFKEKVILLVKKNANKINLPALESDLDALLFSNPSSQDYSQLSNVTQDLKLNDVTKPSYIQTNVTARTWEEAIYIAAAPLLKDGTITRNYIDTIIQNVDEEGPYIMIMDTVALPHARPENGVLEIGIGMTSLKYPVPITKDKTMKYLFTLAAKDKKQHLRAISDLVKLLDNPDFFNLLDTESDSQVIYEWLIDKID